MQISEKTQNSYNYYVSPIISHPISQLALKYTKEICSVIATTALLEFTRGLLATRNPNHAETIRFAVLIKPVGQEIFYRGLIQNGIWVIQKAKNYIFKEKPTEKDLQAQKIFRVSMTALLFGIMESNSTSHIVGRGISILTTTFEGLTYGFLYEKFNTLSVPILFNTLHGSLNSFYVNLDPTQFVPEVASFIGLHSIKLISYHFATQTWNNFKIKVKECALETAKVAASVFILIEAQKILVQWNSEKIINLIVPNVYAPLSEEIIFRGYLQKGIEFVQDSYNACWKKNPVTETEKKTQQTFRISITSFIFGITHIFNQPRSLLQCFAAGWGGMAYGYTAEKFQTLSLSILAHGINNTMASVAEIALKNRLSVGVLILPALIVHKFFWYCLGTGKISLPSLNKISEKIKSTYNKTAKWFSPRIAISLASQ